MYLVQNNLLLLQQSVMVECEINIAVWSFLFAYLYDMDYVLDKYKSFK